MVVLDFLKRQDDLVVIHVHLINPSSSGEDSNDQSSSSEEENFNNQSSSPDEKTPTETSNPPSSSSSSSSSSNITPHPRPESLRGVCCAEIDKCKTYIE
jgi:cytoskeletal protein RodZ